MFITGVLWTAYFVVAFNLAMMISLLPFIQKDFHLSTVQTGLLLAVFPVVALLSNLVLGPLLDKYGRKRFIVIGASGCSVILVLTASASDTSSLLISRAATGVFMPMIGASVFSAIADYVPESNRTRVAGYVTSAAPLALLCSLSTGVLLGGLWSWKAPIFALSATSCILACLAMTLPTTKPDLLAHASISISVYRERLSSLYTDSIMRPLLFSYFFWSLSVYIFLGLYPTWLVHTGLSGENLSTTAAILFFGEMGGLVGALLCGKITSWCNSPLRLCVITSIGLALLIPTTPLTRDSSIAQALTYTLFAFGRDLMLALILSTAMQMVSSAKRGSLNAMLNVVYQTGATVGGIASAWLFSFNSDFFANSLTAAIIFIISAALLNITSNKEKMAL